METSELLRPIAETVKLPTVPPNKPVFFVGDIMLGRHVEYLMTVHGPDYPFKNLGFFKNESAYVVGNFEASVPLVHEKTPNFGFRFSVAEKYLPELALAGFTHLSLANNHSSDFGQSGLLHTRESLTESSFKVFGDSRLIAASTTISYLDLVDTRVALIGLHTLFNMPTEKAIQVLLQTASLESDMQIVYIHWGTEYVLAPTSVEENLARILVKAGADLIIGHHPHVVQSIQMVDGVPVFYSLGNFIFDQYFSLDVQQGLALKLEIGKESSLLTLLPVTSVGSFAQPRLMREGEGRTFLHSLAERSDTALKVGIKSGSLSFTPRLATSTETAIVEE